MKCKAAPYQGEEAFAFFSYCHADSAVVYPLIEDLSRMGYRVWFDDGISIGDEWPEVIAEKLEKCSVFLAAITPAYCRSHNCKNEMTFQVEDGKLILPLMLEDFPLIGGIRLQLSGRQYLKLYDAPAEKWGKVISMFEPMASCKGEPVKIPRADTSPEDPPPENPPPENPPLGDPPPVSELMAVRLPDGQILPAHNGQLCLENGAVDITWQAVGMVTVSNSGEQDTILNGTGLPAGSDSHLESPSVITIGECSYALLWAEAAQWVRDQGKLCCLTSEKTGEIKMVLSEGLTLGRHHRWSSGAMTDRNISRLHAKIHVQDGSTVLQDRSTNGTYVDGSKITCTTLGDGNILRLGLEMFRYQEIALVDLEAILRERYAEALRCMTAAATQEDFLRAAEMFAQLDSFQDSQSKRQSCLAQAENIRRDSIYFQAKKDAAASDPEKLEQVIAALVSLGNWRDSKHLAEEYAEKLRQQRAREQAYQEACRKLDQADSEAALIEAEKLFAALGTYRDSGLRQLQCREKLETIRNNTFVSDLTVSSDDDCTVIVSRRGPAPRCERLILVDLHTGEAFEGKPQSTVLGRKSNQCDISFPGSSTMSRRHAEIFTFHGIHYIRDCHSANGTIVDGQELEADQTVKIDNTAMLTIARMQFLVAFDEAAHQIAQKKVVMVLFEQYTENAFLISDTPVPFTTVDMDGTIVDGQTQEAQCAQLKLENGKAVLNTILNGSVWINGVCQAGRTRAILQKGDSIQIGTNLYRFDEIPVISFEQPYILQRGDSI